MIFPTIPTACDGWCVSIEVYSQLVTTSDLFTVPPLQVLLAVFGIDRVMFSVDYPYNPNQKGRAFLDGLPLAPTDRAKLAHGNADRLLKLHPPS